MSVEEIRRELFGLRDTEYRDFQSKLIPTADKNIFIGVRTPELRRYAKQLLGTEAGDAFLDDLPHGYFDENQLHAFIISGIKDYDACVSEVERFLPYVDNWATCDQMSPKVFGKHRKELIVRVKNWMDSDKPYTVRFGIGMLMSHFLDADFDPAYPGWVAAVRSEEYYVRMMAAWYFATALAKRYDDILPFIQERRLDAWTHNRAIQKAVESRRITPEQKEYLRGLKIR